MARLDNIDDLHLRRHHGLLFAVNDVAACVRHRRLAAADLTLKQVPLLSVLVCGLRTRAQLLHGLGSVLLIEARRGR